MNGHSGDAKAQQAGTHEQGDRFAEVREQHAEVN